jgi:hypothetical protein
LNKNKNVGCFSGILGTLFVILGVGAYLLLSSLLNKFFSGIHLGDSASVALLGLTVPGLTVAFILYEAIFIVHQIKLHKNAAGNDNGGKFNKIFRLVFAGFVCLSLLFAIFSANTFTKCDESSISKVCFVTTEEYRWDTRNDIRRYALSCDSNGKLSFKIYTLNGEIELFDAVNSFGDSFVERFGSLDGYAAYLSEQFDNSDYIIEKRIVGQEYMEKYYKDSHPEIWKNIETIID